MKIKFITSNQGKIQNLQAYFDQTGRSDITVEALPLAVIEPQADSFAEVSMSKAKQAYEIVGGDILVEDGGLAIEALNGFPGIYTKYAINTLGPEGFLRLMTGIENRRAKFMGTATYIDSKGQATQFHRKDFNVLIADAVCDRESPLAWSSIWKILYMERTGKIMAEMDADEAADMYGRDAEEGCLSQFAKWIGGRIPVR